jgi:cobalamin-dependent methionine synthase I
MILIGQNIQTMSKRVREAIENLYPEPIKRLAMMQSEAGADYLEINLCSIMTKTVEAMKWIVDTVQEVVDLPLFINTTNPTAMEEGLKLCKKKAVINSANGMRESKEKIIPLAVKYCADVVIGTYDEQGAPPSADERAIMALELIKYANGLGISTGNIWLDPGLYPVGSNQDQVIASLEFIKMIQDVVPGIKTVTGTSNVSIGGLPNEAKKILNRSFLVIAQRYNQYAAIVNVFDKDLVRLNIGELPQIVRLIHRAMDGEDLDMRSLSAEEVSYVKATQFFLGKEPFSQSMLGF